MLWGSGVTLGPGRRLFPSTCSHISFALPDPIQGQSATSLHTDDLFYTATACGCLVFIQPGLLQEPEVCADPFTRCRFVCGMGELCKQVCRKRKDFLQDSLHVAQTATATKPRGQQKTASWAVGVCGVGRSAADSQPPGLGHPVAFFGPLHAVDLQLAGHHVHDAGLKQALWGEAVQV